MNQEPSEVDYYKLRKVIIDSIIEHLERQKRNQSMSSDFMDGYNYAIFEIKQLS